MIKMSKSRIVQEGSTLEEKILLKKQESFISTNLGIWKGKTNCFCGQGLLGVGAGSVSFLGKVHFYGADHAQVIGAGEGWEAYNEGKVCRMKSDLAQVGGRLCPAQKRHSGLDPESRCHFERSREIFFTKSGLERLTGINQKQLWHYANGKSPYICSKYLNIQPI